MPFTIDAATESPLLKSIIDRGQRSCVLRLLETGDDAEDRSLAERMNKLSDVEFESVFQMLKRQEPRGAVRKLVLAGCREIAL